MQIDEKRKRIAIMGGTFDPIHFGHLASAETVRHEFGFDKIIFIPSGTPPHKTDNDVSDGEMRYLMTSYAVEHNPFFDISRIEIDRPGITYTIDTVRNIRESYTDLSTVYFITGADALLDILTWHDAENLLKICSLIAITRPGYNDAKLLAQIKYLKAQTDADISFMEVPSIAISSTYIRNKIKTGRPIKYLVPEAVEEFIYKNGLYK